MAIKARPTVYKGVKMRSRLEADFAQRYLEVECESPIRRRPPPHSTGTWAYEPQCFASAAGQYLPDFGVSWPKGLSDYYEVKPRAYLGEKEDEEIDGLLRRMEIIWESEPAANLYLFFWNYGGADSYLVYSWSSKSRVWLTTPFPEVYSTPHGIWYGCGQFEALVEARLAKAN